MTSSQLMEEDEIAVCGVASDVSVLLKRGHGSQLGRKSLLSYWLIPSRVNAGTWHLCSLNVLLCFCLGVHRKSANDSSRESGPGWKRIKCAVLVPQTFAWFFPFFFCLLQTWTRALQTETRTLTVVCLLIWTFAFVSLKRLQNLSDSWKINGNKFAVIKWTWG